MAIHYDGEMDKLRLLEIFPKELWESVLKEVRSTSDFQRVSTASPYFHTLLQPLEVETLLPEVLQIMIKCRSIAPRDVLPCRLVRRSWNSGVERALHDPNFMFLFESAKEGKYDLVKEKVDRRDPNLSTFRSFDSVESFTKFKRRFETPPCVPNHSPFFIKNVDLFLPRKTEQFRRYLKHCETFLENYGVHIRYASIDVGLKWTSYQKLYLNGIKGILALMPKLKVIKLVDSVGVNPTGPPLTVKDKAFPELPHFKMISVNVEGLTSSFLKDLVEKNPGITIVSDVTGAPKKKYVAVYFEKMTRLNKLELQVNLCADLDLTNFRWEHINPALSTLCLTMKWTARDQGPLLEPLIRLMNAKFTTLRDLEMTFLCPLDDYRSRLHLPNLKKLTVGSGKQQVIPLDLSLDLGPSLEFLSVIVGIGRGARPRHELMAEATNLPSETNLYRFWRDHFNSDVWLHLPNLKILSTAGYGESERTTRQQFHAAARRRLLNR